MIQSEHFIIDGKHGKSILIDRFEDHPAKLKPIVVFCHGYKGFKDWGPWNVMADRFAKAGFCFIKFNFSFNGGTIEQPIDFPDLEAFGQNNYSKELDDLASVIDWISEAICQKSENNIQPIILIGHSRGGGIATIYASEDSRITQLITLAAVSDFEKRFGIGTPEFENWKKEGVKYILNGRTKQQMPHYFQFYEDFETNKTRLSIEHAARRLEIPHLIVHGEEDTSVLIEEGENLAAWNPNAKFERIANANHVFNCKHPWESDQLPPKMERATGLMIDFIQVNLT